MELNELHSPADIKGLDTRELEQLSDKLREALLKKLSAHGGHV
ncbi:MAG: hypothetical protein K2G05_01705, partial [Duncaniella sp.]|nr:hypothetical protein [Duncaniella sp.]